MAGVFYSYLIRWLDSLFARIEQLNYRTHSRCQWQLHSASQAHVVLKSFIHSQIGSFLGVKLVPKQDLGHKRRSSLRIAQLNSDRAQSVVRERDNLGKASMTASNRPAGGPPVALWMFLVACSFAVTKAQAPNLTVSR